MTSVNLHGYTFSNTKSEVEKTFTHFQAHVERLLNKKITCVQTDGGGEYEKLHSHFQHEGISHRVSCPHSHQQNGSAERKHRHVVEVGLSLLAQASRPIRFWDEAFQTACFLINRLPSKVIQSATPLERLLDTKPDYTFLKSFGCACWPCLRPYNDRKLQFRSKRCVFIGYSSRHKGYKCLYPPTGRVYISRDVIFDENVFPFSELSKLPDRRPLIDQVLLTPILPSSFSCMDTMDDGGNNRANRHISELSIVPTDSIFQEGSDVFQGTTASREDTENITDVHEGSAPAESVSVPVNPPQHPMQTRLRTGVQKPKVFRDGTIRYDVNRRRQAHQIAVEPAEPMSHIEAIEHPSWKEAMD